MTATKEKKVPFWMALAVPLIFIVIILVKIVMTYQAGKATHSKNNTIFPLEEFMLEHKIEGVIDTPRELVEYAKVSSGIKAIINNRLAESKINKAQKMAPYGWVAFGRKSNEDDKAWMVIFRETGINPYTHCTVNINGELVGELDCKLMSMKKK